MNKVRLRTVWIMICVMIITLFFGDISPVNAQMRQLIVYNHNILYINKYNNLVNIKDIINIDYIKYNKKIKSKLKSNYLVKDLSSGKTFLMPLYNVRLSLNSKVSDSVFISRLANAIKSHETGGTTAYSRHSYSSSACGAYQYMPSTWNNFMGYKTACQAPAWVQDMRIIGELKASYAKYHNWEKAVAAHFLPSRAGNMNTWNLRVPGNPTVMQYVSSVFKKANIRMGYVTEQCLTKSFQPTTI
jgi:hypothetical protein